MRRVGDEVARAVEQGAGEVEPLLDVHRVGGVLQAQPHLLGDRHEQVVEDLEQHGVDLRADRLALLARRDPLQDQLVERRDLGLPARVDHRGGVGLGDDRRPVDAVARARLGPSVQRRVEPAAVEPGAHACRRLQRRAAFGARGGNVFRILAPADGFDGHRLRDQGTLAHEERVALRVLRLELRLHVGERAVRNDERRIGSFVAQVHAPQDRDARGRHALRDQLRARLVGQSVECLGQGGLSVVAESQLDRTLAHRALVRQAHAVRGQHAGQGVREDPRHRQLVGNRAGMLPTSAAEHRQRIARHVVAALHRDALDGLGHVADGDFEETRRHRLGGLGLAGGARNLLRERRELVAHDRRVEGFIGTRAEHAREVVGLDAAEHHVRIGDGQRTAAPVARRPGIGAGRVRADAQARAVEVQDRTTARGDRVNAHHRRAHAHAGDLRLELALAVGHVAAGEVRDVRRGAAHVEADDAVEAGAQARTHHADDAAGGPGQNRVLALEAPGVRQAAVALHEQQAHAGHLRRHLLDIAPQDRRQVGVHHGGVAARHQLHQRAGLVRHRDLRESHGTRDALGRELVLGVAVAVHEDDRHRAQAGGVRGAQVALELRLVERPLDLATRADAFVGLDDTCVQQFGQHDVSLEDPRPVLVGDAQRVAKAARRHQQRRLALALEQCIGGHRGAHLHGVDAFDRNRRAARHAEQVADAGDGGVAVLLRVLRQQFVGQQHAVGAARDDVGERATAVDPELPAAHARLVVFCQSPPPVRFVACHSCRHSPRMS